MNILITGADGFIGKNLRQWVDLMSKQKTPCDELYCCDKDTTGDELAEMCGKADFVFHLAGVNRPGCESEFETGNKGFTEELLSICRRGKTPPVLFTSSVQAELDNPYGKSKRAAEQLVFDYGKETGSPVYVYRLQGVFGKWCRPNYNNVVATFCHNIANGLPIEVLDPGFGLELLYIDDVCRSFLGIVNALDEMGAGELDEANGHEGESGFYTVEPIHRITLGELATVLRSFQQSRTDLKIPDMSDELTRKLYSTYVSHLPNFSYTPLTHADERGSFTELLKSSTAGQVSLNVTKPGYTKGNHWHHTKTEKFITVSGQGVIRFRRMGCTEVIEYHVTGDKPEIVDIPAGYTHSLTNTGSTDLVTLIWVDEIFDPQNPDAFYEDVL